LGRLSTSERWARQAVHIMQLPGVGIIVTTPSIGNKKRGTLCVQEPNVDQNVLKRIPHVKL
jgi:hypothetical protein